MILKSTQSLSKILLIWFAFVLFPSLSCAATYYVANNPSGKAGWSNGSNSNNGLSKSTPFLTLAYAVSAMSGGDTLIICDGTYTGANNSIQPYETVQIKSGTSGAWTTIIAEEDGAVIIDGQSTRACIYLRGCDTVDDATYTNGCQRYIKFQGIVCANAGGGVAGCWDIRGCDNIKLINCGAYDPPSGNTSTFEIMYSTYILLEGCYAYGGGRYKFGLWHAQYIVLRNCVSRNDYVDAGGDPSGDFSIYSSTFIEVQNCISIDGDDPSKWLNTNEYIGSFGCPTTTATTNPGPVNFNNCIALNNATRFGSSDYNDYAADVSWSNCVGWKLTTRSNNSLIKAFGLSNVNKCTFGEVDNQSQSVSSAYYNALSTSGKYSTNNIWYNIVHGGLFYNIGSSSYNNVYGCGTVDVYGTSSSGTIAINPLSNGLSYIARIEPSGALYTAGSSGSHVGAVILYQYGKTGSLYGESGYNLLQNGSNGQDEEKLWPFSGEAVIKAKFAAYSAHGITGARGFATGTSLDGSSQTLTKYIWEYLGNQIPDDIYGTSSPTSTTKNINLSGAVYR